MIDNYLSKASVHKWFVSIPDYSLDKRRSQWCCYGCKWKPIPLLVCLVWTSWTIDHCNLSLWIPNNYTYFICFAGVFGNNVRYLFGRSDQLCSWKIHSTIFEGLSEHNCIPNTIGSIFQLVLCRILSHRVLSNTVAHSTGFLYYQIVWIVSIFHTNLNQFPIVCLVSSPPSKQPNANKYVFS